MLSHVEITLCKFCIIKEWVFFCHWDSSTRANFVVKLDMSNQVYLFCIVFLIKRQKYHETVNIRFNNIFFSLQYFVDYKLADYGNSTDAKMYRTYFLSTLGFWAQIPNVILNGLNVFCQCGGWGSYFVITIYYIIIKLWQHVGCLEQGFWKNYNFAWCSCWFMLVHVGLGYTTPWSNVIFWITPCDNFVTIHILKIYQQIFLFKWCPDEFKACYPSNETLNFFYQDFWKLSENE